MTSSFGPQYEIVLCAIDGMKSTLVVVVAAVVGGEAEEKEAGVLVVGEAEEEGLALV